jgi:hypothetical protein
LVVVEEAVAYHCPHCFSLVEQVVAVAVAVALSATLAQQDCLPV